MNAYSIALSAKNTKGERVLSATIGDCRISFALSIEDCNRIIETMAKDSSCLEISGDCIDYQIKFNEVSA